MRERMQSDLRFECVIDVSFPRRFSFFVLRFFPPGKSGVQDERLDNFATL
jgi:hypothetical protein